MKKLLFHVGAHKTGSTHLQATFKANRAFLEENGVWYRILSEFRESFTVPFVQKLVPADRQARAFIDGVFKKNRAAIFSDENLIGLLARLNLGDFYPGIGQRVKKLVKLSDKVPDVRFFVSIRNYADWIESAYLQSLKGKQIVDFATFSRKLDLGKLSWVKCITEILKAAGERPVTVWPYEVYAADNECIINLFEKEIDLKLPRRVDARTNPSYSEVANKILLAVAKEIREEDLVKLRIFLKKHFTVALGYARPVLLDAKIRCELTQRYLQDLKEIRKLGSDRVRLVGFDRVLDGKSIPADNRDIS